MWRGHGYWGYGAGWEGWVMFVFMVVFVVAIVVAVVLLVRNFGPSSHAMPPGVGASESAKDILKRRYAAGEIDREEYLQKLGDL